MSQDPLHPETEEQTPQPSAETPEVTVDAEEIQLDESPEQALIGELQEQVLVLKDQTLRAHAEMENVRRRAQEEIAKARKFALEAFSESLIPVKDSLDAALSLPDQTLEQYHEGIQTTLRQLIAAFDSHHLKEVNPLPGDKFDPNVHQAISSVPNPEIAANCVLQTLQKGYTLSERVLRPALVVVSAG